MLVKRSLRDSCSLCRQDTVKVRLHQWRSQLGTWAVILSMSLSVVLTLVPSLWDLAVKFVVSYVKRDISQHLKRVLTLSRSLLKHGSQLLVAVTLLLVLVVVLLVRVLISLSLMTR